MCSAHTDSNDNIGSTAYVDGQAVRLACYTHGDANQPTLIFVHGYPDTHAIWARMIDALQNDFHCVSYDVRGAGASSRPRPTRAYRLDCLAGDIGAVIDSASPDRPVHLIGHDWGSIQAWEAVTDPSMGDRIASFTSISGPCLDHMGHLLRAQLRGARGALLSQLRKSWYIGAMHLPGAATHTAHRRLARHWPELTRKFEGEALPVSPTRAADGADGVKLYRANMVRRLARPRPRRTDIPVQVITPLRDPFVGPEFAHELRPWVPHLTVNTIDGGHWAPHSRADDVADLCRDFIQSINPSVATPPVGEGGLS